MASSCKAAGLDLDLAEAGAVDGGLRSLGPCFLVPASACGCGCCCCCCSDSGFCSGMLCGAVMASLSILGPVALLCLLLRFVSPGGPFWLWL